MKTKTLDGRKNYCDIIIEKMGNNFWGLLLLVMFMPLTIVLIELSEKGWN